jgi:tetratricopeptide (TPR) repeat protein
VFSLFSATENTEKKKSWRHSKVLESSATEPGLPPKLYSAPNIDRVAIPLLVAFSLALYIATTGYDLVGDDAILIGGNPYVRSFHFLREIFTQNFWSFRGARGDSIYYRPVVMFSFLVQAMLFGPRPAAFHLFNVLLNTWVVVMVYQLGKRFWPKGRGALWGALLFAALPVHTEDVATVSGISDLECAAFFLAALLIYTQPAVAAVSDRRGGEPRRSESAATADRGGLEGGFSRVRAWMSALVFLLAALSKEVALAVPVLMVFYEHFLRGDAEARWGERLSRYMPSFLLSAFYIVVHLAVIGDLSNVGPPSRMHLRESLIFGFTQLGEYTGKLLWPQHLSYFWKFYPPLTWRDPAVLLGMLFTLWAVGVVVAWWRRDRPVSFAIIWFFLTLAPVLNIAGIGVPAYGERYLYIPSVGICWLLGQGLEAMASKASSAGVSPAVARASCPRLPAGTGRSRDSGRDARATFGVILSVAKDLYSRKVAAVALGLVLLSAATIRTLVRLPVWRSNFTLGLATVREDPSAAIFHVYLGNYYRAEGNRRLARIEYIAAIASDPLAGEAFVNLAGVFLDDGNASAAEEVLRRGAQMNPTFSKPLFALGKLALHRGSEEEARDLFGRALSRDPNDPEALFALGLLSLQQGRLDEAENLLSRAVTVEPSSAVVHLDLGAVFSREKKFGNAEAEFRRAIQLAPNSEAPYLALAGVSEDQGKQEAALGIYRQIARGAPDSANAQFRLGVLALKMGKGEEAIAALGKAVAAQPKSALAHAQLGLAYLESGNPTGARREIETARLLDPNEDTVKMALRELKPYALSDPSVGKRGDK